MPRRAESRAPLRVALLGSHRAPGHRFLLEEDGNRGAVYDLVCALTSEPEFEAKPALEAAGVPVLVYDIHEFYRARGARLSDLDVRRDYDRATLQALRPYRPDVIVLAGYLYLLTEPMLEAFPDRIVNVHDSDLRLAGADGRPRYRGLRSTRDAIFAGEPETRATAHVVTAELDGGPPLVRSGGFPVHPLVVAARAWGATDILKAYAYAHREWVIRSSWGPLLAKAIEVVAQREGGFLESEAVVRGARPPLEITLDPGLVPAPEPLGSFGSGSWSP